MHYYLEIIPVILRGVLKFEIIKDIVLYKIKFKNIRIVV